MVPNGPFSQAQLEELVVSISALLSEQDGQRPVVPPQEVHGEGIGAGGDPEGVVGLRQQHGEPGRVDAGLGGETDQASRSLARGSCDDEHRVVQPGDELLEGLIEVQSSYYAHSLPG